MWSQTVDQLKTIAPTEAIDLPGFGEEPLVSDQWGIPDYADWVKEYVEQHKLKDIVLLGHSFGGRITSYIASSNPSWLKAIILVAAPSIRRPSKEVVLRIKFYKLVKKVLPQNIRKLFYPQELQNAHQSGVGKIFRNAVNLDQTNELKKISVPTLTIWGERDAETPIRVAKEMHELIKNSQLEIIKGTGHMPNLDNPHLFYGTIKNFLKNL